MTSTQFPHGPRRDDPIGAAFIVQQNLEFLRDKFDALQNDSVAGSSTIATGSTSVIVTHSLGLTTYAALATPQEDPGTRWWISNKTKTQFQLNLQVVQGADITFDWLAKGV